jgi:PAS domain-containing protein
MSCNLGVHRVITKVLNNKPWFGYKQGDSVIRIFESPKIRINKYTSIGAARTTAKEINDLANKHYPGIGDIVSHAFDRNGWGIVNIHPTKKQLDYINAVDEKEEQRLRVELENERRQKEGNWRVNEEGDVVPYYQKLSEEEKNLTLEQYQERTQLENTIKDVAARMSARIGIPFNFIRDTNNLSKGWIDENGATINLAWATLDTPIHEILGHPIINAIKNKNPELHKNLLKELETGRGKEVFEKVKRDYPELSLEQQQKEAIVTLLGELTADKLDKIKDKNLISLLKELLKQMTEYLRSLFNSKEINLDFDESDITYTDENGNPCAAYGLKPSKFRKGGTWEIIKEFKGKSHAQGGIDIEITNGIIKMSNKQGKFEAKYGLIIPKK